MFIKSSRRHLKVNTIIVAIGNKILECTEKKGVYFPMLNQDIWDKQDKFFTFCKKTSNANITSGKNNSRRAKYNKKNEPAIYDLLGTIVDD
jgi:hypothetical protein